MTPERWPDVGEASQGKIITAILRDDEPEARLLIHGWTTDDLRALEDAAGRLGLLIAQERSRRRYNGRRRG